MSEASEPRRQGRRRTRFAIWNVNGLRSCVGKGFVQWLARAKPDVLGLQEVRAFPDALPVAEFAAMGYMCAFNPAQKPGYSGTAVFSIAEPKALRKLDIPRFDREGRVQVADFEEFVFLNAYFPKGSGSERDNSRVPYKLAFDVAVRDLARKYLREGRHVIVAGDFNTAHTNLDLKNWKTNAKTSGFLPEERASVDMWLHAGFRDVFRDLHRGEEGHYSWWSQRQGARARNVGWRIDYFLVSASLAPRVKRAWIDKRVRGSDHCPVLIEIAPAPAKKRRAR